MQKPKLVGAEQRTGFFDPTDAERVYLHNMSVNFEKVAKKDGPRAAQMFKDTLVPYMESQLRTIKILDDQLVGAAEQNLLLLKSNVLLIDTLKKNGIPMPNFTEVEREVKRELEAKRIEELAAGSVLQEQS